MIDVMTVGLMKRAKIRTTIIRWEEKGSLSCCPIVVMIFNVKIVLSYSFARQPIGRGVRARKYPGYKSQYSNTPTAIHRRSTNTLASDEENTSEYSHPPSSQHSTLESNPDVAKCIKVINQHTHDNLSDSSSGSESDNDVGHNDGSIVVTPFQRDSLAEESSAVSVQA